MNGTTERTIEAIESKHMMSMILYLYENGPRRRMDIYQNVARNSNMPSKIEYLKGCGILIEDKSSHLSLSDSGRIIAKLLQCVEGILDANDQVSTTRDRDIRF